MKKRTIFFAAAGIAAFALREAGRERRAATWLAGKVVLITGSSRGLGLALAEEFGRRGARLVLTARDPEELARAKKALLDRDAVRDEASIELLPCDLTNAAEARSMVELATMRFGQIDVVVNNAGIISVGPVENQALGAFKESIETNYYAALHTSMAVLPQMLARHSGSIVNIASIGGIVAVPHLLPYTASKFALVGFSRGLNAELRGKGIHVTTVCPGLMRTGSHIHAQFTGDREREYRWFSLGASLPGASISATTAAKQVVAATVQGRSEIVISAQASLAAAVSRLAPEATAALLGWVNSCVLPAPVAGETEGSAAFVAGHAVRGKEWTALTAIGEAATHRFNQRGHIG